MAVNGKMTHQINRCSPHAKFSKLKMQLSWFLLFLCISCLPGHRAHRSDVSTQTGDSTNRTHSTPLISGQSTEVDPYKKGILTLPVGTLAHAIVKRLRAFYFQGESKDQNLTSGAIPYWLEQIGSPSAFYITTKDGVRLNAHHAKTDGLIMMHEDYSGQKALGFNKTMILYGGMSGGGEDLFRHASFFMDQGFDAMLVTRRGQKGSEGSSIASGELGIFYDVQATLSYLVAQGIEMKDIWLYGYCLGGIYAAMTGYYFPEVAGVILDRAFPDYYQNTYRAVGILSSPVVRTVYSQIFPAGVHDTLPPVEGILEPKRRFVSKGMSIKKWFLSAGYMPSFFFLYGLKDWVVPHPQTLDLLRSYTNVMNWELSRFAGLSDVAAIDKEHHEFFMKDEPKAKAKLLSFIELTQKGKLRPV
jgi:pimeloyl-ACP methyl ester carboxylesterase